MTRYILLILAFAARASAAWDGFSMPVELHNATGARMGYSVAVDSVQVTSGVLAAGATRLVDVSPNASVVVEATAGGFTASANLTRAGGGRRLDFYLEAGSCEVASSALLERVRVPVHVQVWAFVLGLTTGLPFLVWRWTTNAMQEAL